MVNEEIVTALRNAVEHGESLQDAMQIMMNSGYSPVEVQEASRYIGGGTLHIQQPNPDEHLTMPTQKSRMSNMAFWKNKNIVQQHPQVQQFQQAQPKPQIQQPIQQNQFQQMQAQKPQIQQQPQIQPQQPQIQQTQVQQQMQPVDQFQVEQTYQPQLQSSSVPLAKQLEKIGPRKPSHIKEILLVVVLLILIGVLAATILFKDTILAWFA